jgi:hypothetical protein
MLLVPLSGRSLSIHLTQWHLIKPLEEEETLLEDGTIETSDVELKDTFAWLMSTITFYITMAKGHY